MFNYRKEKVYGLVDQTDFCKQNVLKFLTRFSKWINYTFENSNENYFSKILSKNS